MMINQEDIHIISRNSNWKERDISKTLQQHVYNNKQSWEKFLELFFLSLGVGFTIAGILFFFAYNWSDLHKFVKIGLIEILIISLVLVAVYSHIEVLFKNILLTGSTMLVGVLFAVFGQIYQTGANAYDFFLGWTMAVSIWVFIANFSVLWLLYIGLLNLTLGLYIDQVSLDIPEMLLISLFILGNTSFFLVSLYLKSLGNNIPIWFTNLLALFIFTILTITLSSGVYSYREEYFPFILIISTILYPLAFYYGLKTKQTLYLSIVPFSLITVSTIFLFEKTNFNEILMFLFMGIYIVGSITLVIKMLMNFQKKWGNEK